MKKIKLFFLLLSATFCSAAFAQGIPVSGKVTEASTGEPLVGATVFVEGTTTGATTDANGEYSLEVPSDAKLTVSMIGYEIQTISVDGRSRIDISLIEDTYNLDELIVVAYGTAKRESFTGSVAVVDNEKIAQRKVSNITKALDGLAPGVQATSGSGQPGSSSSIIIRGFGSINASNEPLYVVDGVPYNGAISAINPEDIESISILKDASASVLYGSRAANGVVIINTRRGSKDGITVDLNIKVGVSSRAIPRYETVGAKDYMEIMYSAFANQYGAANAAYQMAYGSTAILGENEQYNPFNYSVQDLFTADGKVREDATLLWEEDWLDQITNNAALRQEYGVSVSGGNDKTQYMFSLGYLNEDGVIRTTNFERYTGRLNVDTQAKPWFAAGLSANFARNNTNSSNTSSGATSNVFYSAQLMAPIFPVYQRDPETGDYLLDANGEKMFDYGDNRPSGQQTNFNSIATLYDDKYNTTSYTVSARTHIDFMGVENHWSQGLKFQVNFGADYYNSNELVYYNPEFGNAESVDGRIQKENITSLGYTFNQLLTWNRTFDKHNIDVLLGHEYYAYTTSSLSGHKTGLPGPGIYELDAAAVIVGTGSYTDKDNIESYFTRLGYSYNDKYFVSGSWRTDGSSRFAPQSRWGNFWSVGASWVISREQFMTNVPWISSLALKASYGVQGNNNVGSTYYPYQALYDTSYPNATLPGAIIGSVANEDLTWESNRNFNVGLEARILNYLDLNFEYYNRTTVDMLLAYPLPISSGFDSYYRNAGSMRNSGIEFSLTGHIFNTKDFSWDITWMGSTVNNKVLKLTDSGADIMASGSQIIREGEELYSFYVARSAGVDPMTGEKMYWATDENGNDYITKSTTVAQNNRVVAGSRIPDLYGSVSTALRWKNLDLSISTNYSIGGKIYDGVYYEMMSCYYVAETKHVDMLRAWKQPGDITDVPKYTIGETPIVTDDKLFDASYFSIKNITLGYTLPRKWTSFIGFKGARFSVSADNVCIFTSLKGMDPQYSFTGGTNYTYAPTRTVSFNIDLKF